jgi:S-formylglutathione hydrolase FrmB
VVFSPSQATNGQRLPIIYYLPGFGNSAAEFIKNPMSWLKCTQNIADQIAPMILVVVDGHTRWGGSQYLNSSAQGNYADYICNEITTTVERLHPVPTNGIRRIIAGHSSGGFGALRLGMMRQELFDGVIALSPDSDFPVSHLPLVKSAVITNVPLAEIERIAHGQVAPSDDGDLTYVLALSAAYAPRAFFHRGQFQWIYDAQGNFRPEVWQRWLDNDPLTIIRRKGGQAFCEKQSIYLDGAAQDEFMANIGAQKMFACLRKYQERCAFYEPPGHHSDHLQQRLQRGLAWVFGQPLYDIK